METLFQDLRYGARMLLKKPGFTLVAVFTLALGIGANSAIFSVVNAVLLRPLPYENPDKLLMVWETTDREKGFRGLTAPANFVDWRDQNSVFEGISALVNQSFNLTEAGEPERITGQRVSANLFSLLGAKPVLGRSFLPEDDNPDSEPVVILSHGLLQRRFGQDSQIVGKSFVINGQATTVVGVMPQSFHFQDRQVEMWVPAAFSAAEAGKRHDHYLRVVARLKPEVTLPQAQAEMDAIAARLEQQYPKTNTNLRTWLRLLQEDLVSSTRPTLLILLGAVGFVLLIACANVANLLLARATSRQKEIAVRIAVGAGRIRLIRQLLTESILLAGLGGMVGLGLGLWGIDLLAAFIPDSFTNAREVGIDGSVLGFTVALSLLTGIIFGLAPALQSSRIDLNAALKEGGLSAAGRGSHIRSLLVVSEIALALVLFIGAGLLIRSFVQLNSVDTGFESQNLLTMRLTLPQSKYRENEKLISFFDQMLERVEQIPGVESAGITSWLPITSRSGSHGFTIEGQPAPSPDQLPGAGYRMVSPDYFRAMRIPLLRGRMLSEQDSHNSPPVIVISQAMAERYWPGEDAIGKRIKLGNLDSTMPWTAVIGVVGNVSNFELENPAHPFMYANYRQASSFSFIGPQDLVLRTTSNPLSLASAVRNEIWAVDKDLPVSRVQTMEQILGQSVSGPRFNMMLLAIFAMLALALAAVGIYGVMSYSITQSTREIGIRMALGAQPADILRLVLGQGLALTLSGVVIGLVGAFALTRLMASLLYGVTATDPVTFAGVSALLLIVAMLACYVPARRAARVDPMEALRYE